MAKKVLLTLNEQRDAEILEWLERQNNKSAAIRALIRQELAGGVTLGMIYQELREVRRQIKRGVNVATPAALENDVPADILDNLSNLGL